MPDDVIVRIIGERLTEPDAAQGVMFDGFPQPSQAEALDGIEDIDAVISIEVPDDEIVGRSRDGTPANHAVESSMTSISLAALRMPLRQFRGSSKGRRFGINGSSTLGDLPCSDAPRG